MESEDLDSALYSKLQESLKVSPADHLQTSVSTLQRLLQNIADHPEEAKFRSIKKSNKAIQSKLLSIHGMPEILSLIGFRAQDADTLSLTDTASVDTALTMMQVFESELREMRKTEEQKDNDKRQLEIRRHAKQKEEAKKRLMEQAALDRKETNTHLMPTQDSHAVNRGPGQVTTFKGIGVDLNTAKKG